METKNDKKYMNYLLDQSKFINDEFCEQVIHSLSVQLCAVGLKTDRPDWENEARKVLLKVTKWGHLIAVATSAPKGYISKHIVKLMEELSYFRAQLAASNLEESVYEDFDYAVLKIINSFYDNHFTLDAKEWVTNEDIVRVNNALNNTEKVITAEERAREVQEYHEKYYNPNPDWDKLDEFALDVLRVFLQNGITLSVSAVQRKLRVGYPKAGRTLDVLADAGFISENSVAGLKVIRITLKDLEERQQ